MSSRRFGSNVGFLARSKRTSHVDSTEAFGRRLLAARLDAGLSQRRLGGAVGCSAAYISRIESGDRRPSLQLVRAFADELDVDEEFLARGSQSGSGLRDRLAEAEMASRLGDLDEAARLFEALEADAPNGGLRSRCLAGRAQVAFLRGEHVAATELFEAARALDAHVVEDASFVDSLGRAYALLGAYDRALELFDSRLRAAKRTGDSLEVMRFQVLIANTLIDCGAFGPAGEVLAEALEIAEQTADPFVRARLWWSQSRLHAHQNNADAAARYARLALDTLSLTEHAVYAARAHQLLAHIELDRGNAAEALRLLVAAFPVIEASGNKFETAAFRLERARAHAALGENEEAVQLVLRASPDLRDASPTDSGRGYALLGEVYEALGDPARAIEVYELAAETLPAVDRYLLEVYGRLGAVLRNEGRLEEAVAVLSRAVELQGRWAGGTVPVVRGEP